MSIGMSPFRALYGYDSFTFLEMDFGDSRDPMDKEWIHESQDILRELKDHLKRVQHQWKLYEDKHIVDHNFKVRDLVYPRLQEYRHASIKKHGIQKLKPHFYGPYRVKMKVG
jgi:hypothetical protein